MAHRIARTRPSPTVVVVTGAAPLDRRAVAAVPAGADRSSPPTAGSTTPAPPGSTPTVLVGDLDSISRRRAGAGRREHAEVERHPVDKTATDTELALAHAARRCSRARVLLVAGARRPPRPRPRRARRPRRAGARPASPRSRRGGAPTSCASPAPDGRSTLDRRRRARRSRCSRCTGRATASRSPAPAGRSPTPTLGPLVGLGVSQRGRPRRRSASPSPPASSP